MAMIHVNRSGATLGIFDEEKVRVTNMIERAADAIKWAIDNGIVSAMNTFNPETVNKAEET